ncbi:MAG: 3-isopropylmalate dehydrogenase [Clostridiales bacterium]|jgi:3-isopropylmalate dehydrogenase|nr:3-isopropylmalate dehydrogenase [Clostridiales bacterium]
MVKNIAVIEGDGIGAEIIGEAVKVLRKIEEKFGHTFHLKYVEMGGCAIDRYGVPLPAFSLEACQEADAVLLGAVGGPKWDDPTAKVRPEQGLLGLRAGLGCFANIRPAKVYTPLAAASPLKEEMIGGGFELVVVRELTGGIYFGESGRDGDSAYDTERYSVPEITRIAKVAFELARGRKKIVHSIDKANVLESSRLWRETVARTAREYPDITVIDMLVDNAAMQLVRNPAQFDVLLTSNLFGDILSDEASQITGSIGMLASASTGEGSRGLYEPIHGSAPDLAGRNIANPIAAILSAAMMLDLSFGMREEAYAVERAVDAALDENLRTADIATEGGTVLGTVQMGGEIVSRI